ncbi:MAG: CPBP family intramembrane metalloprotease [Deltaproteobacteria bacterium]|nr:CPBP family intramembrane metalloprotease [Deltaproteobacteria bacterium]
MAVSGKSKEVPAAGGIKGYLAATRSPMVAGVVTLPLLLLYNVGLMVPGNKTVNAADLFTTILIGQVGKYGFLAINGVLVCASVAVMVVLTKRGLFRPKYWLTLCLEGLALGLVMGHAVMFIMGSAHLLSTAQGHHYSVAQSLSLSAGAGYWEELVFRLVMIGGPIAMARRVYLKKGVGKRAVQVSKVVAVGTLAVIFSSLVFSLSHYLGSESIDGFTFSYRAISGVVFAAIFLVRGFAVAAYTHFLYDVVVFLF